MTDHLFFIAVLPDEAIQAEVARFKHYAARHFKSSRALRSPAHITLFSPFRWPPDKLAQLEGAKIIALDINEQRLLYAKEKIGADYIVNALDNPLEQIREFTRGDLVAAVFDATGNTAALEGGMQYMAHGGRYVLVGLSNGELTFSHPAIHRKEATLICSRNATVEDFQKVREALSSGQFPVDSYITHRVPFTEMIGHFDSWRNPENEVMKAMVFF